MRIINVTIEIEDNDLIENNLFKSLDGALGTSMRDFRVLPDTKELYENDPNFRELCKKLKECKKIYSDYINKKNKKYKK